MAIKNGATVRQIVSAPQEGEVQERRFNDTADAMEYHVKGADGTDRWFLESQIEIISEPKSETAAPVPEGA